METKKLTPPPASIEFRQNRIKYYVENHKGISPQLAAVYILLFDFDCTTVKTASILGISRSTVYRYCQLAELNYGRSKTFKNLVDEVRSYSLWKLRFC